MNTSISLDLLVATPEGPIPLTADRAQVALPQGPDSRRDALLYGPYLEALATFLKQEDWTPLKGALGRCLGRPVPLEEIRKVEIISEKHGALYHVAHVKVHLTSETCELALNVAVSPREQAVLEREFALLGDLKQRFGLPYLPAPALRGRAVYRPETDSPKNLQVFLAEWFEGFHEFHLSSPLNGGPLAIRLWDSAAGEPFLTPSQTCSLYRKAAFILASYLDPDTFSEIFPWHHAAGDFVARVDGNEVQLRLITVRGIRRLLDEDADPEAAWFAVARFFIELTLRLRLDRLDGTRELVWAGPECLAPIVDGFLDAWNAKAAEHPSLPPREIVKDFLGQFSSSDWMSIAEVILGDDSLDEDDLELLKLHLPEHARQLTVSLSKPSFSKREGT